MIFKEEQFIEDLKGVQLAKGEGVRKIAEQTGLNFSSVWRIITNKQGVGANEFAKLCAWAELNPSHYFGSGVEV